jgi:nucleoid DNA-binding protein
MTWHQLVAMTAQSSGLPQTVVTRILTSAFVAIADKALHGQRVVVPGFGVFYQYRRKACRGLHPITHVPIDVPAKLAVGYHCSRAVKR